MNCGRVAMGLAGLVFLLSVAGAAGAEIAPGVTFTIYHVTSPKNVVYVVAMDRSRPEYKLEVGWPQKKRNFTAFARTSTIANLYDNPAANHDVLAATNGGFFDMTNPGQEWVTLGLYASAGEMQAMPSVAPQHADADSLFFGPSRKPVVLNTTSHAAGTLTFANGTTMPLDSYNTKPAPINKVTAYTPAWDSSTRTDFSVSPSIAVEVVLGNVSYPMRSEKQVSGIVTAIYSPTSGNATIPAGGMVLTAWGSTKTTIVNNAHVGDRLLMSFKTTSEEYNNADMAVSGLGWLVHNGVAYSSDWSGHDAGGVAPFNRNPRTALGFNNTYLYMIVCDGRSAASLGMTFQEMANFLIGTLGVQEAINLDSGGSSTMVADIGSGLQVQNVPSDGSERSIQNAVLLVKQDTSTVFPFPDRFGPTGRLAGWDDKFTYNDVGAFSPASPGGDGYAVVVGDPAGGVDTLRRGDFGDADYAVEADVYCEYRPDVAGDGFERYALFARDSGTGALGLSSYGGGNCYAITFDSDDGRIRAGKYVNGSLTNLMGGDPMYSQASAWHRFRIACQGSTIEYRLDGSVIASVADTSHTHGYFGIGYQEFFTTDSNIHGTRADSFLAYLPTSPVTAGDFDGDGDVDQADFGHLQVCFTGPEQAQIDPACLDARLDADSDVDPADFGVFQGCLSGANVAADVPCPAGG